MSMGNFIPFIQKNTLSIRGKRKSIPDFSGKLSRPDNPRFRAAGEVSSEPLYWYHWTYAGHQLVADILVESLATP